MRLSALLLLAALAAAAEAPRIERAPRDGFDLYYRVYGDGAPVAVLSGGPGLDCDYMEPVARELARTHRAILIELRGTGRSIPPAINRDTINLQTYLADLEAVRQREGIERWTLLGHSAGAVLTMAYVGAHPERLASAVLVSSGEIAGTAGAMMDNIVMRLTPEERATIAKLRDQAAPGSLVKLLTPGFFFDRDKGLAMAAQFQPESLHPQVLQLLNANGMGVRDFRPGAKSYPGRVLVITGRQDPLDPGVQMEIQQSFRNAQLKLLPRCGHFPWIEQTEQFYAAVREFLAGGGR